jgi:hypothetical protein
LEKVTKEVIQAFIHTNEIELSSTHAKLCVPIINRIYRKMLVGVEFSAIKVENNIICDGHHRYLASLLANFSIERIPASSTSATTVIDWKIVAFEEEDWDTEAEINMLNEQDARYNDMAIEKLVELLNKL